MARIMLSTVRLPMMSDITKRPSRITVTLWQVLKTSASRWEMNSTAAPWERRVVITSKRRSTSALESAAVGSSITITRALKDSALAISTICWSATDSPRASVVMSMRTPRRSRTPLTTSFMPVQLMRLPRTDRLAAYENVLCHRQVGEQCRLLVNHCDPGGGGAGRPVERKLLTVQSEKARVGPVDAREDFNQGRLAGTVFAHQAMGFAGVELDGTVRQGVDGPK